MTVVDLEGAFAFVTWNSKGELIKMKYLDAKINHANSSASYTQENGMYIANPDGKKLTVYKYNDNDTKEWQYETDLPEDGFACKLSTSKENNVVIKASKYTEDPNNVVFLSLNPSGKELFKTTISIDRSMEKIIAVNANEFITAHADYKNIGKFIFLKMDKDGKVLWQKSFGNKTAGISDFIYTKDGGYAILAGTEEYGAQYIDAWIIKTDSLGNTVPVPKKYQKKN